MLGLGHGIRINKTRKRGGAAPFVGLLDEYPGAVAAYDSRLLRADYSGALKYVRAFDGASDQGTAGVLGYKIDNEFWIDLNSKLIDLDATALGRGLTESDTLADLVSAGVNNYDGYIANWCDQSGNGNDQVITDASRQYRCVINGSLVLKNGRPANYHLEGQKSFAPFTLGNQNVSVQVGAIENRGALTDGSGTNSRSIFSLFNTELRFYAESAGLINPNHIRGNQELYSYIYNAGATTLAVNDSEVYGSVGDTIMGGVVIGGAGTTGALDMEGYSQSIIFWDNLSIWDDISDIRTNVNSAYNIYTP